MKPGGSPNSGTDEAKRAPAHRGAGLPKFPAHPSVPRLLPLHCWMINSA